jgi:hypothetical protein
MFDPSLMVQQGPNPGERFAQAFQQGQQTRQQNMAKAAMAPGTVVADPRLQGGATGAAPSSMFP